MCGCSLVTPRLVGGAQQLRQLGDVGGNAPGLVAGEEMRRRPPSRLLLAIDVSERLPVGVADDKAGVGFHTAIQGGGKRSAAERATAGAARGSSGPKGSERARSRRFPTCFYDRG
jgi:hypothetical protein